MVAIWGNNNSELCCIIWAKRNILDSFNGYFPLPLFFCLMTLKYWFWPFIWAFKSGWDVKMYAPFAFRWARGRERVKACVLGDPGQVLVQPVVVSSSGVGPPWTTGFCWYKFRAGRDSSLSSSNSDVTVPWASGVNQQVGLWITRKSMQGNMEPYIRNGFLNPWTIFFGKATEKNPWTLSEKSCFRSDRNPGRNEAEYLPELAGISLILEIMTASN